MDSRRADRRVTVTFTPIEGVKEESISWLDGELEGKPFVVEYVLHEGKRNRQAVDITPTGPFLYGDEILKDVLGFVRFMEIAFEEYGPVTVKGKLPTLKAEEGVVY